jgi:hypothetical protein
MKSQHRNIRKLRRRARAFAVWSPDYGLNHHWVRPYAKQIRDENWPLAKERGMKVVPVMVTLIGRRPKP